MTLISRHDLPTGQVKAAIVGSGNIGTDLMYKISRTSKVLHLVVVAGIDPDSDGLAHARKAGVETTSEGLEGLLRLPASDEVAVVFDATSAQAHSAHNAELRGTGRVVVDLTPAALGPFVVPPVNLDRHIDRPNVNMVTCGGQATIPIVAAISAITQVHYAEIVAAIASRSAGAGTRANIDEFTETTRRAIVEVGGAKRAKAIIILNPAEPPMVMRDTVMCLVGEVDESAVNASVHRMVEQVGEYVPGYRLKQEVQFERVDRRRWIDRLIPDPPCRLTKVTVFLEIEGAGHYLPSYAGNLDIMTSAALRTGELIAATRFARLGP